MDQSRFDSIDTQLSTIVLNQTKFDTQLEKLMTTVVKGFDRIDKTLEEKADATMVRSILGSLDEVLKNQKISDDERLVMGHQLDRLDKWVHELATKIGYTLAA